MKTPQDVLLVTDFNGETLTFLKADEVVKRAFTEVEYFKNTKFGVLCLTTKKNYKAEDIEDYHHQHNFYLDFNNIWYVGFYTNHYEELKKFYQKPRKYQMNIFEFMEDIK